jgi:hypothetical protein
MVAGFVQILAPLENVDGQTFSFIIDALRCCDEFDNGAVWRGARPRTGRMWGRGGGGDLSTLGRIDATGLAATFNEIFSCAVVRPPYGGHPRVAIYGLLKHDCSRRTSSFVGG